MIFQDNIVKKYLQIHSKKYGILNNFYFYCKESFIYNKLGFILSLFLSIRYIFVIFHKPF